MVVTAAEASKTKSPIEIAVTRSASRLDRFNGLPEQLAKVADVFAQGLAPLLGVVPDIEVAEVQSQSCDDFLGACAPGGVFAALALGGIPARLLYYVDARALELIIDAALGGTGIASFSSPQRAPSTIDNGFVQWVVKRVTLAVSEILLSRPAAATEVHEIGASLELKGVRRDRAQFARVAWHITINGHRASITMGLALDLLAVARTAAPKPAAPPSSPSLPEWTAHFERHVAHSPIPLIAVLEEREVPLGEIAVLRPGDLLELQASVLSRIRVECADMPVMWCRLGRSSSAFALQIEEFIEPSSSLLDLFAVSP